MQDLTQHRDAVANCRKGFVPSDGFVLLGADYSQVNHPKWFWAAILLWDDINIFRRALDRAY
eukprot:scaffold648291_cov34-Prasinocladus_malaysianus.AAC.1